MYIHVPFCLSKCAYCNFYSVQPHDDIISRYTDAVIKNIPESTFDTVYFGGGTPTVMSEEIGRILKHVNLSAGAEVTAEANPDVFGGGIADILLSSGVNRVSFGVQSMCDKELVRLGRRHNSADAIDAVKTASKAGFGNISADIILGIPLQDIQSLGYTIDTLCDLPVNHISAYILKIEEGTLFYQRETVCDEVEEKYLYTADSLEKYGFMQYEISNFAQQGYESRHNLKYWRLDEYIGIGPSAHSFVSGKRYAVHSDIDKFVRQDTGQVYCTDENAGGADEYIMLGLRLTEGILYERLEGFNISKESILKKCKLIPQHLINITDKGISLTKEGFLLSNSIIGAICN